MSILQSFKSLNVRNLTGISARDRATTLDKDNMPRKRKLRRESNARVTFCRHNHHVPWSRTCRRGYGGCARCVCVCFSLLRGVSESYRAKTSLAGNPSSSEVWCCIYYHGLCFQSLFVKIPVLFPGCHVHRLFFAVGEGCVDLNPAATTRVVKIS